jgi:hypothetical protein
MVTFVSNEKGSSVHIFNTNKRKKNCTKHLQKVQNMLIIVTYIPYFQISSATIVYLVCEKPYILTNKKYSIKKHQQIQTFFLPYLQCAFFFFPTIKDRIERVYAPCMIRVLLNNVLFHSSCLILSKGTY